MPEPAQQAVETCESCKFMWPVEREGSAAYYECRCHAPTLASVNTGWPTVKTDDWCGEYVAVVGSDASTVPIS